MYGSVVRFRESFGEVHHCRATHFKICSSLAKASTVALVLSPNCVIFGVLWAWDVGMVWCDHPKAQPEVIGKSLI